MADGTMMAGEAGGGAGRRRLTPEERLPQILEAALDEFAERGYGRASMAGAAARAGIAKGLIYHYFPGKDELFKAVVRSCIQPVFTEAERMVAGFAGSKSDLLRLLLQLGYERVCDTREGVMFKLLIAEADRFPELAAFYRTEVLARGLALARELVRAGIAAGEFRPEAARWEGLPAVLLAPVTMAGVWRIMLGPDQAPDPAAMRDAHLALVLGALRRAPPGAGEAAPL